MFGNIRDQIFLEKSIALEDKRINLLSAPRIHYQCIILVRDKRRIENILMDTDITLNV